MKRRFMMFLIAFLFMFFISPISYAEEEAASQEEILSSQQDSLNISSFIKEAQKYTTDTFEDLDLGNLFSSAITGNVDNEMLLKAFSKIIGKEVVSCINVLGSIIIIIVIHSILKSISEGLENKSISQITYYVQYILIVTLIMKNFADILTMVRTSIDSLVGFMNSLVPLLITLMLTTGNIASAGITEPIILFIITFIGNFITTVLIPFILIANVLGIVSKVSPRVQVDKLSKFFNSSVVDIGNCANYICRSSLSGGEFKQYSIWNYCQNSQSSSYQLYTSSRKNLRRCS